VTRIFRRSSLWGRSPAPPFATSSQSSSKGVRRPRPAQGQSSSAPNRPASRSRARCSVQLPRSPSSPDTSAIKIDVCRQLLPVRRLEKLRALSQLDDQDRRQAGFPLDQPSAADEPSQLVGSGVLAGYRAFAPRKAGHLLVEERRRRSSFPEIQVDGRVGHAGHPGYLRTSRCGTRARQTLIAPSRIGPLVVGPVVRACTWPISGLAGPRCVGPAEEAHSDRASAAPRQGLF